MRRLGLIAVAMVLAGCGSVDGMSDPASDTLLPIEVLTEPEPGGVIEVLPDSEIARMLAPTGPAEPWPVVDSLSIGAGTGERWTTSTEPATDEEVVALADVLGVDGALERFGEGAFGAEVRVGNEQGATGMLVVSSYSEPTWYLQPSDARRVDAGLVPCPTLIVDDQNSGQCADVGSTGAAEPPSTAVTAGAVDALMAVLGVPAEHYRTEYFPFLDVVDVHVSFGRSDAFGWSLRVATGSEGQGVVVEGSGPLRTPELLDEVPTVDLGEALQRLSKLVPGVPVDAPADAVPAGPPSTVAPPLLELPTIEAAEPAFATIWDIQNRQWLVPALLVSGRNGFATTIPIISADFIRVVDPPDASVSVRTGPPLTVPPDTAGDMPPPTTMSGPLPIPAPPAGPPPTGTGLAPTPTPVSAPIPPIAPSTTTMPGTTLFPRPTSPGPSATLVDENGTPMTIPIPPDRNQVAPDAVPDFYEESLNAVLVGRSLDEALTLLEATGWEIRIDDLDDPNNTFRADLRSGRVTVQHRGEVVTLIVVG